MRKKTHLKQGISSTLMVLISCILLTSACSTTEENVAYGIYPVKKDRVSFSIDDETKAFTLNVRYFETTNGDEQGNRF